MSQHDDLDRSLARWFDAEAHPAATADMLDRALDATRGRRPYPRLYAGLGSHWVDDSGGWIPRAGALGGTGMQRSMALLLLLLLVVLALAGGAVLVGGRLVQPGPVDLGIFGPVAGRIVFPDEDGIRGIDPAAPADPATTFELRSGRGIPLGWSGDGTELLIMRGSSPEAHLFVVHADGSEVQVTERPMSIAGATISPDGSRVVFAGATADTESALYAVDADGGAANVLVGPQDAVIRAPTYSPDGTRIAYTFGGGDHSHHVWVIGADGSDPHEIIYNAQTAAAGHVRGLVWSPTGDLIALGLEGSIYTFAPDGSGFTQIAGGDTSCDPSDPCAVKLPKSAESPYWSPDGSQIAFTTGCVNGAGAADRDGCHLAIADADGSNVLTYGFPTSGPWHPAPIASATESAISAEPGQLVLNLRTWSADPDPAFVEVAVYADGRVIWVADERVGFVEQRLTAGGVERLRSRVLSAGLFDGNLALGIDGVGWGNVTVKRGDQSVIVAWGSSPTDVSGLGLEENFVRATAEQAAEVSELEAFLRDPVSWEFPDDVYVQHEVMPYVPSHLWVGFDRRVPILSDLPTPAREILTRVLRPPVRPDCELISIAEAQEIAQALAGAEILEPSYEVRRGFAFDEPGSGSFVHLHPALPHDVAACTGH